MDRLVTIKFNRIVSGRGSRGDFGERLVQLANAGDQDRRKTLYDVVMWVDKIEAGTRWISGRFCREQRTNLPPRAPSTGGLEPLGIDSIGQTVVWRYDRQQSVLAFEAARNGLTLGVFLAYIRVVCDCRGYSYMPVTGFDSLGRLQGSRIRSVSVRLALPANLELLHTDQAPTKQAMTQLMSAGIAAQVEVSLIAAPHGEDLRPPAANRFVRWMRREKAADRGGISALGADVITARETASNLISWETSTCRAPKSWTYQMIIQNAVMKSGHLTPKEHFESIKIA